MSNKEESAIITSIENGIQKVIFNRPAKKNALTKEMYQELINILNESAKNEDVLMLVISGNGDFYSSGNDFVSSFISNADPIEETERIQTFVNCIITYPKLLVAIANGPAVGISATTLALFDIVYASETAYFWTPFSRLGLVAEGCSTYTFPRILGQSKAGEMLYFGEKLTANEAAELGFVSKVYKIGTEDEIWAHLRTISTLSKESLAATKKLVNRWNTKILMEVNHQELTALMKVYSSPNFAENMVKLMTRKSKM